MNSGLKSGLVLLILGIISGTLLAVVNYFTAPIIDELELQEKNAAIAEFYDLTNYNLTEVAVAEGNVETVYVLTNKTTDAIDGLVYLVTASGYGGDVKMMIAVNSDYTVQGYKVVSHSESPGYGAEIVGNDFNVSDITDLSGFDAVAGSTYTSNAILACFQYVEDRIVGDFGGALNESN